MHSAAVAREEDVQKYARSVFDDWKSDLNRILNREQCRVSADWDRFAKQMLRKRWKPKSKAARFRPAPAKYSSKYNYCVFSQMDGTGIVERCGDDGCLFVIAAPSSDVPVDVSPGCCSDIPSDLWPWYVYFHEIQDVFMAMVQEYVETAMSNDGNMDGSSGEDEYRPVIKVRFEREYNNRRSRHGVFLSIKYVSPEKHRKAVRTRKKKSDRLVFYAVPEQ